MGLSGRYPSLVLLKALKDSLSKSVLFSDGEDNVTFNPHSSGLRAWRNVGLYFIRKFRPSGDIVDVAMGVVVQLQREHAQ